MNVFAAENYDFVRHRDLTGEYTHGSKSNDAFIFSAKYDVHRDNRTIQSHGGNDSIFILDDSDFPIQITGRDGQVELSLKSRKNPGKAIETTTYKYLGVGSLKGRGSIADHIALLPCSLNFLDTNNGANKTHQDLITIWPDYKPCVEDLQIVVGKHVTIFNMAKQGSFTYSVANNSTQASLFINLNEETSNLSHMILVESEFDQFRIKVDEQQKQTTYIL